MIPETEPFRALLFYDALLHHPYPFSVSGLDFFVLFFALDLIVYEAEDTKWKIMLSFAETLCINHRFKPGHTD